MNSRINRSNITEHLLSYELAMVEKTLLDTFDDDNWYFNWPITKVKHNEFRLYALKKIKKVFKINREKAEAHFQWHNDHYGLRIKD